MKSARLLIISFALCLLLSGSDFGIAKEFSSFLNTPGGIEFGTVRQYTLNDDRPIVDKLLIENSEKTALYYELTAGESINTSNGNLVSAYNTSKDAGGVISRFVSFSPNIFMLQPNERREITINIKRPDIEYLNPGDYIGAFNITYSPAAAASGGTSGLAFRTRNTINFVIKIPGEATFNIEKGSFNIKHTKTALEISQKFTNSGSILAEIKFENHLRSNDFWQEKIFDNEKKTVLPPGQDFTASFSLPLSPLLLMDYNFDQRVSISTYDSAKNVFNPVETFTNTDASTVANTLNITLLLGIVALAALTISFLIVRKISIAKSCKEYVVKNGDTLDKIAKSTKCPWRIIARLNRLKPPYILQEGTNIRIPAYKNLAKTPRIR